MRSSRWPTVVLLSLMANTSAWCQEVSPKGETKPAFDAVSIRQIEAYQRVSSPGSTGYLFTRHLPCVYSEDKVVCQLALGELILEAYQRKRYELVGPKWLSEDVFVLQALLPGKTGKDEARVMLQHALEDRFALSYHLEKKSLPVYEMVVGPGGLRLALADPPELQKKVPSLIRPGGASMESSAGHLAVVAAGLDYLAYLLERSAGLDRPVMDGTGMQGKYKVDLHWTPSDAADGLSDTGIVGALKTQAGLVLKKTEAPIEMLVIDRVNRTPTANP